MCKERFMKQVIQNERGMALAIAIVALVIVGALVAGAFFAGTQEQRIGENQRFSQQAFGVAEEGVNEVVRGWDPQAYNSRGIYGTDSIEEPDAVAPTYTGRYGGYVYKLNDDLYMIDLTGRDSTSMKTGRRGTGGRARIGLLTRIDPLKIDIRASLTTARSDVVTGNASINGMDQIPPGWTTCGPVDSTKAGVRTDAGTTVSQSGSSMIIGNPPVMIDSSVTDTTFTKYGNTNYADLSVRATITLPGQNFSSSIAPVVTNGQCDKTVLTNWGDGMNPTRPCGSFFPIVHITGDANINGQQGQGILLVDGSLTIQGGFQWFGITIIRGTLKTAGGGTTDAHFWGATMVQDSVVVGTNQITGHANINYSKCAILRSLRSTGMPVMMRSRSWVQLF